MSEIGQWGAPRRICSLRRALCIIALQSLVWAQEQKVIDSFPPYHPLAALDGALRGHSSAGMRTLMKPWGDEFKRIYPNVRIELDNRGYREVDGSLATFGPWLGKLHPLTHARIKKRFGFAPIQVPVCWYVLGIHVHKHSPVRRGLSLKEVETIFSFEFWDVTWGDLGCQGEWFKVPVRPYAPGPHRFSLQRMIGRQCGTDLFWFKDSTDRPRSDAAVVRAIAADARGIGLASIELRTDRIRTLAVAPKGKTKFVPATAENAYNGLYPLADMYHLVLNYDPNSGKRLDALRREFLRYIMSKEGQAVVAKAGFTPLTVCQAKRSLAELGFVLSGEDSPWDRVLIGLRLRSAPADEMERVERLAMAIGRKTTLKELRGFNEALALTHLRSTIHAECDREGAIVRYRPVGAQDAEVNTAKKGSASVRVGLYHIWTERGGKATSSTDKLFQIVREKEQVKLHEKR